MAVRKSAGPAQGLVQRRQFDDHHTDSKGRPGPETMASGQAESGNLLKKCHLGAIFGFCSQTRSGY
jgi:hypothetical protein